MSGSPFFVQSCPSCGRSLQISVYYLGHSVVCQHCHKQFSARDVQAESAALDDPIDRWIGLADQQLETAEHVVLNRPR